MILASLIGLVLVVLPPSVEGLQGVVQNPVKVDRKEDVTATVLELSDALGNISLALQIEDSRTGKLNRGFIETTGRVTDLKVVNRSRVVVISRLDADRRSVMLFDGTTARLVDSFEALKVMIDADGMIRFVDPIDSTNKIFDAVKMSLVKKSEKRPLAHPR